jgi:hypothetical protein
MAVEIVEAPCAAAERTGADDKAKANARAAIRDNATSICVALSLVAVAVWWTHHRRIGDHAHFVAGFRA